MKRIVIGILFVILLFSLVVFCGACGESDRPKDNQQGASDTALQEVDAKDALVVVFSATGTTKGVAQKIARLTGAELKEILPSKAYTSADLNYGDANSRTSKEQNDPSARPEIASEIDLEGCKILYLGYPIWWGQAPRIMSTFVESKNFEGITVIPFCTSGSSDIGQSDDALAAQAGSGNWLQGKRFPANVSEKTLQNWLVEVTPKSEGGDAVKKDLRLFVNDTEVSVEWQNNESVNALKQLVSSDPLVVNMSPYGGFEQVGDLGTTLPQSDTRITTEAGDVVLYSGDQIVLFYGSNTWAYTKLGKIVDKSTNELRALLDKDNVTITISYGG